MSSLGRKLSRLSGVGPGSKPVAPTDRAEPATRVPESDAQASDGWDAFRSALRSKADREGRREPTRRVVMELPGERTETVHGPLRRIVTRSPLDAIHGGVAHGALRGLEPASVARYALDEAFHGVDPSGFVFLDTETTGLAGGTGTVPFLVGIGRIDGDSWVVEQWFLERFGEERPILARLAEVLEGASALVTYNGKSFDWPLLRSRYVLHRMPIPRLDRHLDLVHGARRVLKDRLPSVRLSDVERSLLGFHREGDVDGAEIPGIYLEFQRTGSHPDLLRVVRHHALDLVAMPAILVSFARHFSGETRPEFAEDRLACARVLARAPSDPRARRLAESLIDDGGEAAPIVEAELLLAASARRAGDAEAALAALARAVARATDEDTRLRATTSLAKHLEHRARDLDAALGEAERLVELRGDDEDVRRVERIRAKIARRELASARLAARAARG